MYLFFHINFSTCFFPQIYYALYSFSARCANELSISANQRVRILEFQDMNGNQEWWLGEAGGRRGYVPSNYIRKSEYTWAAICSREISQHPQATKGQLITGENTTKGHYCALIIEEMHWRGELVISTDGEKIPSILISVNVVHKWM